MGKLPNLKFVESTASATNFKYALDTVTGDLPDKLPKIMKVYFIPQTSITLLDPDRSTRLSKALLFPIGPEVISPTQFKYKNDKAGEFIIDLNTGNFKFQRGGDFNPATAEVGTLPQATKISSNFIQFLNSKALLKPQIRNGRTKVVYNNTLLKDSSTATVSIWPNDINKYPIETPLFDISIINQVVKNGLKDEDQILTMNYTLYDIDQKTTATYPIKSVSNAFSDLKSGQNTVLLKVPTNPKVSLRNIYLAYYLPETYTQYLAPIYVFEGQDFAAYVKAIPNEYLEK